MRHGVRRLLPILGLVALLAMGCSDPAEPVYPPDPEASALPTEFDPSLEPSAAVLALVPADATRLEVTDFDQLRLTLGFGSLGEEASAADHERFWTAVEDAAVLSEGLLRPVQDELEDFGFTQDDVAWEARYTGGADGWVIALRDDLPLRTVQRAIDAGVGPLDAAVLDRDRRLVLSADPPSGDASWAAEESLVALVGREANTTYVDRACIPFDRVFGEGMRADLAAAPAERLAALEPLEAFSVAFGAELATVRLGAERSDAFDRLRLDEVMPRIQPDFRSGFARGVADPGSGRLGYDIPRPEAAVRLVEDQHLPFAVCSD